MIDEDTDKEEFKIIIDEIKVLEEKVTKIINLAKSNNAHVSGGSD